MAIAEGSEAERELLLAATRLKTFSAKRAEALQARDKLLRIIVGKKLSSPTPPDIHSDDAAIGNLVRAAIEAAAEPDSSSTVGAHVPGHSTKLVQCE